MKKFLPFIYAFATNGCSFLISALSTLVIPRFLGITEYGYWQLYMFYVSYVGIFHLGWNDGIYLRYGGKQYDSLDKETLKKQFIAQLLMHLIIALIIFLISRFIPNHNKKIICVYVLICMLITNLRCMLIYVLQMTGRIREYAIVNTLDRLGFGIFVILLLYFNRDTYISFIFGDLFCHTCSLLLAMYYCKDIFASHICSWVGIIKEIYANISCGSKLMFANLASMLITGVVRLGIEHSWNIETFGKISLTISISNFLITFINSVGIVVYPMLKNLNLSQQKKIFLKINNLFEFSYAILICYYPLYYFIRNLLPEYKDTANYILFLFPVCIYEGKLSLLYLTYLKALRKEKQLMIINIFTVFISLISTLFTTILFHNLNMAVLSITILIFIRSTLCELYLAKILGIYVAQNIIKEIVLSIVFILANSIFPPVKAAIIYILSVMIISLWKLFCYKIK